MDPFIIPGPFNIQNQEIQKLGLWYTSGEVMHWAIEEIFSLLREKYTMLIHISLLFTDMGGWLHIALIPAHIDFPFFFKHLNYAIHISTIKIADSCQFLSSSEEPKPMYTKINSFFFFTPSGIWELESSVLSVLGQSEGVVISNCLRQHIHSPPGS